MKIPPHLTGLAAAASIHVLPVFTLVPQSLAPTAVTIANAGSTAMIRFANSVSTATKTEQFVGVNPGRKGQSGVTIYRAGVGDAPAAVRETSHAPFSSLGNRV